MHHRLDAVADLLVIDVDDGHFERIGLAGGLVGDVSRYGKSKPAFGIGFPCAFGDQLAVSAIVIFLIVPVSTPFLLVPAVPARSVPTEGIVLAEHGPADLGVRHWPPKVVRGERGDVDRVALDVLVKVCLHLDLVLGFLVLGNAKARAKHAALVLARRLE